MNRFFYFITDPLVVCWTVMVLAGVFYFSRMRKTALTFFILSLLGLFITSVTPLGPYFIYNLEHRYRSLDIGTLDNESEIHILVLGGGHTIAADLPVTSQLSDQGLSRLIEGVRIYRQVKNAKLICSGKTTQADVTAAAAVTLGISPRDTIKMRRPMDTREEILDYKGRFGTANTVIVVTSASHMHRAMSYCKQEGLKATAAPTDYHIKKDWKLYRSDFKPSAGKIEMLKIALHEYAGFLEAGLSN